MAGISSKRLVNFEAPRRKGADTSHRTSFPLSSASRLPSNKQTPESIDADYALALRLQLGEIERIDSSKWTANYTTKKYFNELVTVLDSKPSKRIEESTLLSKLKENIDLNKLSSDKFAKQRVLKDISEENDRYSGSTDRESFSSYEPLFLDRNSFDSGYEGDSDDEELSPPEEYKHARFVDVLRSSQSLQSPQSRSKSSVFALRKGADSDDEYDESDVEFEPESKPVFFVSPSLGTILDEHDSDDEYDFADESVSVFTETKSGTQQLQSDSVDQKMKNADILVGSTDDNIGYAQFGNRRAIMTNGNGDCFLNAQVIMLVHKASVDSDFKEAFKSAFSIEDKMLNAAVSSISSKKPSVPDDIQLFVTKKIKHVLPGYFNLYVSTFNEAEKQSKIAFLKQAFPGKFELKSDEDIIADYSNIVGEKGTFLGVETIDLFHQYLKEIFNKYDPDFDLSTQIRYTSAEGVPIGMGEVKDVYGLTNDHGGHWTAHIPMSY